LEQGKELGSAVANGGITVDRAPAGVLFGCPSADIGAGADVRASTGLRAAAFFGFFGF